MPPTPQPTYHSPAHLLVHFFTNDIRRMYAFTARKRVSALSVLSSTYRMPFGLRCIAPHSSVDPSINNSCGDSNGLRLWNISSKHLKPRALSLAFPRLRHCLLL